jgi:hypothetical protein
MANAFLTPENIARVAIALVGQDLNLAATIHRDYEADFAEGKGATVSVRVPGAVAAQTRGIFDKATPLVLDEIAEQNIPVTLTDTPTPPSPCPTATSPSRSRTSRSRSSRPRWARSSRTSSAGSPPR